jgi:hypothetical protein
MPKKSTKSRSKRVTLHQKYKVLKKIKEHHRKKAKELKKKGGRVKPPKDPGIPASWPFKEQLLQEIEFERYRAEQAKLARKEAAKERRVRARRSGPGCAGPCAQTSPGRASRASCDVAQRHPARCGLARAALHGAAAATLEWLQRRLRCMLAAERRSSRACAG